LSQTNRHRKKPRKCRIAISHSLRLNSIFGGHDDWLIRSGFRAESTCEINDQAYYQKQAEPAAADNRATKVKPAAAE